MAVCARGCGARVACPQRRGVAVATARRRRVKTKEGHGRGARGYLGSQGPVRSLRARRSVAGTRRRGRGQTGLGTVWSLAGCEV